ncbi:MAG: 1,4-dihydroxy-6-naphthoate synthase [Gammaproteobacteria bacterium]
MTERLTLAYSPCPNDTYIYGPIALGEKSIPGVDFEIALHDVETLNRLALEGFYDISKVSCGAYLKIRRRYRLLDVGAAVGYGCGPLLVARKPIPLDELAHCSVAFPGELTTAYSLFRMLAPHSGKHRFVRYDDIIPLVAAGAADCGVVIHESRFTFRGAGLHCLVDLGRWWETETGLPLPLGCTVIKNELYDAYARPFEALVRKCLAAAVNPSYAHVGYIHDHAREMQPAVLRSHIGLYVNDFTESLAGQGMAALNALEQRSLRAGILT